MPQRPDSVLLHGREMIFPGVRERCLFLCPHGERGRMPLFSKNKKAHAAADCMTDHQQSPLGGVGGTAVPLTYIRIAWLCRAGGEVSAAAETIPYIFHGRQPWLTVKNAKAFLDKVTAVTLSMH